LIAIIGAKAREDKAWEIYFESASTLNDAIDDLNAKRAWYAQEKSRRDEENQVLDEVINMFIERVSSLDAGMRRKVDDNTVDLGRRTDNAYSRDSGKLASNVDSESRSL